MIPTLAAFLSVALMVKLGFWQYDKAEQKRQLQSTYDSRMLQQAVSIPHRVIDIEDWRYRRLVATGHFDATYQIFLDNQVEGEVAGYHVITPFIPNDGGAVLLVDRGWVEMGNRASLPVIRTSSVNRQITGFAWIPSTKYYELGSAVDKPNQWQTVWENINLSRYAKRVPFETLPFVLRLDSNQPDGFERHWVMPAERIEMHLGYAFQWWGFAATVLIIWLYVNFKRNENDSTAPRP